MTRRPTAQRDGKLCKLLILGDSEVGKTTLLKRLETGKFVEQVSQTDCTGIPDYIERDFDVSGKKIRLQVWDTAGHERYNSVTTQYFRSVDGYILAYDITKEKSFSKGLMHWKKLLVEHSGADPRVMLIGTKLDLSCDREIVAAKAQEYKNLTEIAIFYETSAKTGENVEKSFEEFLEIICSPREESSGPERDRRETVDMTEPNSTNPAQPSRSRCPC